MNRNYINQQLFILDQRKEKNNDIELPFIFDPKLHLFEVQLNIYVAGRRFIRYQQYGLPLTPQALLYRYLIHDDGSDEEATAAYNRTREMFRTSIDATAGLLANMVTPNLSPEMWLNHAELEHEGILIVPVWLTVSDMRHLVVNCPSPQCFPQPVTKPEEFCKVVMICPHLFDFVPYLEPTRLDLHSVYITRDIKYCQHSREPPPSPNSTTEKLWIG